MGVKRGDIVLVAAPGEFGKPRPAVIIQSDRAVPTDFYTYFPISSDLLRVPNVRIPISPTPENGLRLESEVMVDMVQTSSLAKFGPVIGAIDAEILKRAQVALAVHVGLL